MGWTANKSDKEIKEIKKSTSVPQDAPCLGVWFPPPWGRLEERGRETPSPPHLIVGGLTSPFPMALRGEAAQIPKSSAFSPTNHAHLGADAEANLLKAQSPMAGGGSSQIFYSGRLGTCSPPTAGGSWVGVRPVPKAEATLFCAEEAPPEPLLMGPSPFSAPPAQASSFLSLPSAKSWGSLTP